ncbi:MAG: transcription-repair coupling factor [Christensenellaceae bacterium]|jgi:transcription-repair coupling factor (superfamily II helicase)|nr:transcription-repair coupling factor [Christensenellaceae bacterium]
MLPSALNLNKLGDNFIALKKAIDSCRFTAVVSATQNSKFHLSSRLERFFLYISSDYISARKAVSQLSEFSSGKVIFIPEKDDFMFHARAHISDSIVERIRVLSLLNSESVCGAVITAEGLLQYFPKRELFTESLITLSNNDEIDTFELANKLITISYKRVDVVTSIGEFSVRGDIFDIWPINTEMPVRISFFADIIETIRLIDPESMLSVRTIPSIGICPRSDILISKEMREKVKSELKTIKLTASIRLTDVINDVLDILENSNDQSSLSWIVPFINDELTSIFSYLPRDAVIIFDDPKIISDKLKLYTEAHQIRVTNLSALGEVTRYHLDSMLDLKTVYNETFRYRLLSFQLNKGANPIFDPEVVLNIKSIPITQYSRNNETLIDDLKLMISNGSKIFIYAEDEDGATRISKYLFDNNLDSCISSTLDERKDIIISPSRISGGFNYPQAKVVLIGTDDIIHRSSTKKKSQSLKRQTFIMPEIGDYVIHDFHGMGVFEGITPITTKSGTRDYYVVLYKGGDKLYLPVEQMDSLEKYTGGSSPELHRLGGSEFEKIKIKARESIKKLAIDLIGLYEKRAHRAGHTYQQDTVWQKEMEDAFEFTETEDQLIATAEIKEDMESGKVMDRLLCGDVGFGKTEVAIRAIFKTIIEGKQAVLLAPTSILCQQHYTTMKNRLGPFGINIDMLSRFTMRENKNEILKRIADGKTNVIVATHRILNKNVVFNDLGLLVLDEEQRFGVEHKERLKLMHDSVNVLALSATPIPRTLHMSLSGIRDISTLETPPANRIPVETYVTEYSDNMLIDAIKKEIARGGQVFVLYNRVETIQQFSAHVSSLLDSNAKVVYAHGRMDTDLLEDRIESFYNKEANVLIATTIIENGIDIPDANTLIVIDADQLGLADMYQLRGRVGRSYKLAYAYFTVRDGKVLTVEAQKRLNAIVSRQELGSGFKIAMDDMEIRGVGNVMGREQHGNMEKIGYEMYCRILHECIGELNGEKIKGKNNIQVVVDGNIYLPNEYINDSTQRVRFYKRAALLTTSSDEKELITRLTETYGAPPQSVLNLMSIGLIKNRASKIDANKVEITKNGIHICFPNGDIIQNENVMKGISAQSKQVMLSPAMPPKITFKVISSNANERIISIKRFLLSIKLQEEEEESWKISAK